MPNRTNRQQFQPTPKYGKKFGVKVTKPAEEKKIVGKIKKEMELVVPKTIAGKITNKRYSEIRHMKDVGMGYFAALVLLYERGQFPGELLFSGTRKQLLDKRYRKLVKAARKELQARWLVKRAEMITEMSEAKKQLEAEGKIPTEADTAKPKRKRVQGVRKTPGTPRKAVKPASDTPPPKKSPESSYTNGNLPEINDPNAPSQ